MKLKWTQETTVKVLSNCAVVAFGLFLFFTILNWDSAAGLLRKGISLVGPFIWGFVFAYLLSTPLNFYERTFLKKLPAKLGPKGSRTVSVVLVMLSAFLVLGALVSSLIPQLIHSISQLVEHIPQYKESIEATIDAAIATLHLDSDVFQKFLLSWEDHLTKAADFVARAVPYIFEASKNFTVSVANAIIGVVVAVYLLFNKEKYTAQFKKILYALFPTKRVDSAVELARSSHKIFGDFISGKLLDSLIVGILCFIGCSILRVPYALLISVIVGVTNVIPFFGPIIGAVPCVFILLIVDPRKALWFTIFIIALQQFDGNVLTPRILGDSIGIDAMWVMFAILVGGGLFGFLGMFLGVPAFAVLYLLIRKGIEGRLAKKGLPVETTAYDAGKKKQV